MEIEQVKNEVEISCLVSDKIKDKKEKKMNKRIDEIYSSSAGRQVLGSIIQKPELLKTHQLQASDFVDAPNQIIFMAIDYIARSGATQIDPFEVGEYLKQNYSYFYNVVAVFNVFACGKAENLGFVQPGPGVKFCVSVFRQSQEWRWKAGRILA